MKIRLHDLLILLPFLFMGLGCGSKAESPLAGDEFIGIFTHTVGGLTYQSQLENISEVLERNDQIVGVSIRGSWRTLQPSAYRFEFEEFDDLLDYLSDKHMRIVVNLLPAGSGTPLWLEEKGAELMEVYQVPGRPARTPVTAIPWDPVFMSEFESFLRTIAPRLNENQNVFAVSILGHNVATEMHMPSDPENMSRWESFGLTRELCYENWIQYIDLYSEIFPDKKLVLTLSNIYDREYNDLIGNIAQYAVDNYPDQIILKNMQLHGRYEYLFEDNIQDGALVRYRDEVPTCWETVGSFHFQEVRQGSVEMTVFNMLKANPLYVQLWNRDAYYDPSLANKLMESYREFKDIPLDALKERLKKQDLYHDPEDDYWTKNRERLFLEIKRNNAKVEYLRKYDEERAQVSSYFEDYLQRKKKPSDTSP